MHKMLELQHNGVKKNYKRGFPVLALCDPTQRKEVQGEKSGE